MSFPLSIAIGPQTFVGLSTFLVIIMDGQILVYPPPFFFFSVESFVMLCDCFVWMY